MESISRNRGVTVIELARSYDSADTEANPRLEKVLHEQVDNAEPPLVVVDMSRTASIDSTFIGLLFAVEKRLARRQGKLALCAADVFCSEVFRVVKLDSIFKSYPTRDEAVDGLKAGHVAN